MDIHVLCHGLGNQLSQYAFFLNKRGMKQNAHAFYAFKEHNGYELERILRLKEGLPWYLFFIPVAFRLGISRRFYSARMADSILSLFRIKIVVETGDCQFDPGLLEPWFGIRVLFGGWHDARYFRSSENTVKQAYRFPELDGGNLEIIQKIDNTNSVSIHVRRGDYLKVKNYELFGEIATAKYYKNAVAWVKENCEAPTFFIFSDDISWSRENLDVPDANFVNINNGTDSWKDMVLMSKCKINIIANSTFSWWAAWLNAHPHKQVLCPTKFIRTDIAGETIYLSDWRQIEG